MALYTAVTRHIAEAPPGPKVAAFFDLDRTLVAGFSANAFFRERLLSGRMSPRELTESLRGVANFAAGRTGFSGLMAATTAAYRGLSESVLAELVRDECFESLPIAAVQRHTFEDAVQAATRDRAARKTENIATRRRGRLPARRIGFDLVRRRRRTARRREGREARQYRPAIDRTLERAGLEPPPGLVAGAVERKPWLR